MVDTIWWWAGCLEKRRERISCLPPVQFMMEATEWKMVTFTSRLVSVIVSYSVFYRSVISVPSSLSNGCVREVLCLCHSSVTVIRHCDGAFYKTKHLSSNLSWLQRVIGHDRYGGEHVSRKAGMMLKQLLKVHILIYKHERERQKELIGNGIGF